MLGAVIGDIIGSTYEFNNVKTTRFPLWTSLSRPTDDTVCTLAVADALLTGADFAERLKYWVRLYPFVGYGKKFLEWALSDEQKGGYSWGNGAIMRLSPVGFLFPDFKAALSCGTALTRVTHNHPMSLTATAAYLKAMMLLRQRTPPKDIKHIIEKTYGYSLSRSVDEIRQNYHAFYVRCERTVPEAMTCALEATSFEEAIRLAVSLGGDSDTLACMAGALAEWRFGIPTDMKKRALSMLDARMQHVLKRLYAAPCLIQKIDAVSPLKQGIDFQRI